MVDIVRWLVTWLLWKLGWLGRGLLGAEYKRPDPDDPQYQPIVNEDHPLFACTVERLDVRRCIMGENQWFTVLACGLDGERLGGVKLQWKLERAGVGTVIDMPNWIGETRETDGACRFFHTQLPCRYTLVVEGTWLVKNIRTDLPWKCYANGYCTHADPGTFWNPGKGGWLAVLKPGKFGYWCLLGLRGDEA